MKLRNFQIEAGDLVMMKYVSFWQKKYARTRAPYTEQPLLVMETHANAIKIMLPDGTMKSDLAEYYEVVNE